MSDHKNKLWVEKYRPQRLEDYIFQDTRQKLAIAKMIADGALPHMILSGVQGTGKTTLAFMLMNELEVDEMDYIIINASEQNSVDTIRDDIKAFITTCGFGEFKYVLLEEADYISLNGQAVLRRMMEDYADSARFILTCNYEHKIMPAIRSRCQQFRFKAFDRDDIAERVVTVLAGEKVKFKSLDTVDKYIAVGYPDIRKIINLLQQNTFDGMLHEYSDGGETGDYKFALLDLIAADDWVSARDLLCGSVATEEWEDLYTFLYNNLNKSRKFSNKDNWEAGIVVIADHLYKNAAIADPEINAAAMLIRLSQIGE